MIRLSCLVMGHAWQHVRMGRYVYDAALNQRIWQHTFRCRRCGAVQ